MCVICLFCVQRYIGLFHDAVDCLAIYCQILGSAVNNTLNRNKAVSRHWRDPQKSQYNRCLSHKFEAVVTHYQPECYIFDYNLWVNSHAIIRSYIILGTETVVEW